MFVDFDNPPKSPAQKTSRFQVTRSTEDVEVPMLPVPEDYRANIGRTESNSSSPTGSSPTVPSYRSFSDSYADSIEKINQATTVSTTSTSNSYYNTTIYASNRYNKKNLGFGGSMDHHYFPLMKPHSNNANAHISHYSDRVLVYNFLQRPTGFWAIFYHVLVSIFVISCLILTIISTSKEYESLHHVLNNLDYFVIGFFTVEFLVRLWASECVSFYRGWNGKIRFFKNPVRIIDLIVILMSLGAVLFQAQGDLLVTSLRGVRFIQIFQMVRLDFKFRPWRMMASVVYSQRIHLAIVFYMGFLALIFISFIVYFVEKDFNEQFNSLASSMWWAMITLTTIGYGDASPQTSIGKVLCCICSIIGVSIFALPAGILGTGLALKVQEQRRQLKMSKRKQPAARVIQSAWRYYRSLTVIRRISGPELHVHFNSNSYAIYSRFQKSKSFKANGTLTRREMLAVHFMFGTKLSLARQDFVNAFKPYDIKDVLEQYAAGHADMLAKVKLMDNRLEKIQANRAQNEFRIHVAAHLAKLEVKFEQMSSNYSRLLELQLDTQRQLGTVTQLLIAKQNFSSQIPPTTYHHPEKEFDMTASLAGDSHRSQRKRRPSF